VWDLGQFLLSFYYSCHALLAERLGRPPLVCSEMPAEASQFSAIDLAGHLFHRESSLDGFDAIFCR
jgi:hypothetical protein